MTNQNPTRQPENQIDALLPRLMAYWGNPNSGADREELAFMLAEALAPMARAAMARLPRWVDNEIHRHGLGNPAGVVLMKLLEGPRGFDPQKGRLSAYVGRMMSNACADLQRKTCRLNGGYRYSSTDEGDEAGSVSLDLASLARHRMEVGKEMDAEEQELLLRALHRYANDCEVMREALHCVEKEGHLPTLAALGKRLNMATSTVHRRMKAAQKALSGLHRNVEDDGASLFALAM